MKKQVIKVIVVVYRDTNESPLIEHRLEYDDPYANELAFAIAELEQLKQQLLDLYKECELVEWEEGDTNG